MTRIATATLGNQQSPNGADSGLIVTPASGPAGSPVAVTAGRCQPGTTVTISFRARQLGTVRVSQPGSFSTTIVIPYNASKGAGTVAAVGPGCHWSAPFVVRAGAAALTPGAPSRVPSTQNVVGLLEVVGGLGVFGVVLLFAIRRPRQTTTTWQHSLRLRHSSGPRPAPNRAARQESLVPPPKEEY